VGCFIGPQPMWRKALHNRYGYFDETFSASGDWEFWLRIAEGTTFLHINELLGLYFRSLHSLGHKNPTLRMEEHRLIYKAYIPKYLPAYDEYFTGILGTEPSHHSHIYRYGQILAAFDRYDEAIRLYTAFLQKNPLEKKIFSLIENLKALQLVQKPTIKVTAIVSAYNSEKFIRGCLEDLVDQTLYHKGGLEIIVVISGSQQNEEAVVKDFEARYAHILSIKTEERETIYAAWNRGIKKARGEYITNANTDDRHRQDALEIMARVLDENPSVALVYGDQIITTKENETFTRCTSAAFFQLPEFDRDILLHRQCIGPQPMWRKTLHEELGYFREEFTIAGDYEWWLRVSEKYPLKHIPELLGLYLWNPVGTEHSNQDVCQQESAAIRKYYMEKVGIKPQFERYTSDFIVSHYAKMPSGSAVQTKNAPPSALPKEVMAYINQADGHIANNDFASAREAIQQALRHASEHPQIAAKLSNILAKLGSPESADTFPGTKKKDR
jgi:glycosyltransferase involved in cell wall biosynthesis